MHVGYGVIQFIFKGCDSNFEVNMFSNFKSRYK